MAKFNMTRQPAKIESHPSGRPAVVVCGLVYVGKARKSAFNPGNKVTIVCRATEDGLRSVLVKDASSHKAPERFLEASIYGL